MSLITASESALGWSSSKRPKAQLTTIKPTRKVRLCSSPQAHTKKLARRIKASFNSSRHIYKSIKNIGKNQNKNVILLKTIALQV